MTKNPGKILTIQRRINNAINLGESHFREFRSAYEQKPDAKNRRDSKSIARDVGETLVAFANADGGELLVGVEDDGRVTGVPHIRNQLDTILNAPKTHIHADTPITECEIRTLRISTIPNSIILYFSVQKSSDRVHLTSNGRCLQRKDKENIPVSPEQIQKQRHEKMAREYDRGRETEGTTADLNLELISQYSEQIMPNTTPELFLQYLNLAEYSRYGLKLKRAALLLFAKDIAKWHPRSQMRIIRVVGTSIGAGEQYEVEKDETTIGNIMELLTNGWNHLRPQLAVTKLGTQGLFRETLIYPELACQEALINAIAHRDYSIQGRGIEIYVFDDRMELVSPGRLLSTVKVEDLRALRRMHESRNPYITRVLREIGYMRELGEGIPRIFRAMAEYDLVQPELLEDTDTFKIILYSKSMFSERDEAWLKTYSFIELSKDEQKILLLGMDGKLMTANQVIDILKIIDIDDYRKVLESMLSKGLIYSTLTDGQIQNLRKKAYGGNRREVPRFLIRNSSELSQFHSELSAAIAQITFSGKINTDLSEKISSKLSKGNPYQRNISMSLKYLGYIGTDRQPLPKMLRLWE